jgi:hypothetical protein
LGVHEETQRRKAWIRLRGTPDDPESWDLGTWNGIVWEVKKDLPNGRRVTLQIRDYLVIEQLAPDVSPSMLYRDD